MEILSIALVLIYIAGAVLWLYYWSQACYFLKEQSALSFFWWPLAFFPDKFKPEGDFYRKKSLVYLLVQILPLIIFVIIQ